MYVEIYAQPHELSDDDQYVCMQVSMYVHVHTLPARRRAPRSTHCNTHSNTHFYTHTHKLSDDHQQVCMQECVYVCVILTHYREEVNNAISPRLENQFFQYFRRDSQLSPFPYPLSSRPFPHTPPSSIVHCQH